MEFFGTLGSSVYFFNVSVSRCLVLTTTLILHSDVFYRVEGADLTQS